MQQSKNYLLLLSLLMPYAWSQSAEHMEQPSYLHINIFGLKPIIKQLDQQYSHQNRALNMLAYKESDEVELELLLEALPDITGYALELTKSDEQANRQLAIDSLQHLVRLHNAAHYFTKSHRSAQLNQLSEQVEAALAQLPENIAQSIIRACTFGPTQGSRELIVNSVIPRLCFLVDNAEIIISKIDLIDGDQSLSKVCIIESKIDELSDDLFSLIDEVNINITKTCSGSTTCTGSGDGFTSVFGTQITEGREDYVSIQYQYGISDFDISTSLVGTGTTSTIESSAVITTAGGAGDVAQIESKRNLRNRPGHEGFVFFTVAFTGDTAADSTQLIGIFDDNNGYAVGYNGTTFSILHRRDGSDTFVPQSSFNVNTLDGTGPSGFTYDPSKLNVFRISYGWLGAAPITFRILTSDGNWEIFHIIERPGTAVGPSILDPILPMRAQVINTGDGNSLELRTASWNAGIVGSPSTAAHRYFSASNIKTIMANDDEVAMVTIRNKSTFESKPNKIEARIAEFGGGAIANDDHVTIIRMRLDSTLDDTSFSN